MEVFPKSPCWRRRDTFETHTSCNWFWAGHHGIGQLRKAAFTSPLQKIAFSSILGGIALFNGFVSVLKKMFVSVSLLVEAYDMASQKAAHNQCNRHSSGTRQ
jgi:hypothetical protein